MLTANEIRDSFKSFFESKGHQIVPSAPMVIKDDPTLMFTNAGMNQFKDIILGNHPAKYKRVADSQKCLRVSGKHNDLEEVGHDTYHHTMFEMLGNWSFGDYFKKEAISWAWEYLVDVLKINPENLYATVFEGSPEEGLSRDDEAASYWEQFLPKDHIINGNKHDNFWEMGDTGPCGPCSEIHIDLRSEEEKKQIPGRDMVNHDHPQVIEIWNLVFMQFNRKADGSLEGLPAKVIDTGMGFERLCMAMQGKTSNYDTDVFQPLIQAIAAMAGAKYGEDKQKDVAMRVIADHIRTIAFSITDGQLPSNAKAGYVIRRILRRAVRYGYTFLGQKQSFMYKLLPVLIDNMGAAYPELNAQKDLIAKVIKEEEEAFLRTLETGIRLLEKTMAEAKAAGKTEISGKDAFTLYDTFGFPLDLTELILKENGMTMDREGFDSEMAAQKARARNAAAVEATDWVTVNPGEPEFVGYDNAESVTRILRYRLVKQKKGQLYQIVLARSPFYAEMGGQVADHGYLVSGDAKLKVTQVKKTPKGYFVHTCELLDGTIHVGDEVTASVDTQRRMAICRNHTATHLLQKALREVLGEHVHQAGSYQDDRLTHFDFTHFSAVTPAELAEVERRVNEKIYEALPVTVKNLPIEEAKKMGAMALFGEKYGNVVRVVDAGGWSTEFCGGTHVTNTAQIGCFKILSESSVAAGIRRIEAVTGKNLLLRANKQETMLHTVAAALKANNVAGLPARAEAVMAENKAMSRELEEMKAKIAASKVDSLFDNAEEADGVKIASAYFTGTSGDTLRGMCDTVRDKAVNPVVAVLVGKAEDKITMAVTVTKAAQEKGLKAGALVKEISAIAGGKGGGKPDSAMGGGTEVSKVDDALAAVDDLILSKLG
mgnify:CR=1 FL=1